MQELIRVVRYTTSGKSEAPPAQQRTSPAGGAQSVAIDLPSGPSRRFPRLQANDNPLVVPFPAC
jgi:hypothetical protein